MEDKKLSEREQWYLIRLLISKVINNSPKLTKMYREYMQNILTLYASESQIKNDLKE